MIDGNIDYLFYYVFKKIYIYCLILQPAWLYRYRLDNNNNNNYNCTKKKKIRT